MITKKETRDGNQTPLSRVSTPCLSTLVILGLLTLSYPLSQTLLSSIFRYGVRNMVGQGMICTILKVGKHGI